MATSTVQFEVLPVADANAPARSASTRLDKKAKDIEWSNVNFVAKDKIILKDCWGAVPARKVCAIMGPSGSGKSSLLNVLAGRASSSKGVVIEGKIKVGGLEINPVQFRKNIAYVMQEDALMSTATPREALRFSASLRLPNTLTSTELDSIVDQVLSDLGLTECADVLIGGALIKGISGGQKKRTSVGVEIITDPTLLFLDEPTSGLDSHSAFNLIKLLKQLAQTNCAILCTIHQPSSEVFFLFDYVIYMKDGRIFFQGSTESILPFYKEKGHICPENYNPSDFVMNLLQRDSLEDLEKMGLFMAIPDQYTSDGVKSSQQYISDMLDFHSESGFLKQLGAITYREMINNYRDVPALIGRFGVTIMLNLLYGLIFLNAGNKDNADPDNFNTHFGAIAMIVIFALFGSGQSVLLSFPFERPMILKEYATGTYGLTAYFLSKVLIEAPMTFVQMIVQFILVYFMVGLQGNFILLVLACWGLGMVSNSVAMGLGCLVPDVKDVTELAPLVFVPQILFAGFFIRTSQIPIFLRWAQYVCSMKYAMNLILLNEFDTSLNSCQGAAEANCQGIQDRNNVDKGIFYVYIILLFALFAAFRLLGLFILNQKAKRF